MVFAVIICFALFAADHLFGWWNSARYVFGSAIEPIYRFSDFSHTVINSIGDSISSQYEIEDENNRLRNENLILRGLSQQMSAIQAENGRLRALLNSTALLSGGVQITEVLSFSPNPLNRSVIIDKGRRSKVYSGQAVIDSDGLMGQVTEVYRTTSRVLLLIDSSHAVPVLVNRNGVRAIASGMGFPGKINVKHVAVSTDIRVGDELVSSGLGERFPPGYPVAIVTAVDRDEGREFAKVIARPAASFDSINHLLLVSNRQLDLTKDQ